MAVVMARCNPSLRNASAPRQYQSQVRPCRPVTGFVRFARPMFARPSAFNRCGGWDEASASAMRDMYKEMNKQFQQGNISGGIYWPGGGYTFKGGRWMPCQPNQTSKDNSTTTTSSTGSPSLPLDVVSTGDFYLLYADVPGLAKSDLSIKLTSPTKEPRLLKVSGQRNTPWQKQEQEKDKDKNVDNEQVIQQQRVFGSFAASWELPADADSEGISAKVSEGVLTITVPKKQQQPQPEEEDDSQDIFVA